MEGIKIKREGNIQYFIFSRKEKSNALSKEMLMAINVELSKLPNDIKYIVFRGEGNKFGAGIDLKIAMEVAENENEAKSFSNELSNLFKKLLNLDKITIALIEGFAIGAHLELLMFTDINIAESKAYFSTGGARIGLIPAELSSLYLLFLRRDFLRYIITAERFEADKALELGLIDYISNDPLKKLKEVISVINDNDFYAIQKAKKLRSSFFEMFIENFDRSREEFSNLLVYGNVKERARKFFEKR